MFWPLPQFWDQHLTGKSRYHNLLSTIFIVYRYLLKTNMFFYIIREGEVRILWKGEGISWDVFRHFDWLTFVDHQRKNRQNCGNYTCVKSSQFLKYHRSVTKQTNPLKVDNLITNKSVTIVEAPRRILKHYDSVVQSSYQVAEVENMSQWYKSQSYNRH